METSTTSDRRTSLRPKISSSLASKPSAPKKAGKNEETPSMPLLIAGREVLGRELNVLKPGLKDVEWVRGSVKAFNEPQVLHQIAYKLPLPTPLREIDAVNPEEWLCLGKSPFHWTPNDKSWPYANVTYSKRFTPEKEKAIGQRVKVFWTAMARWYQGKVVSYDNATGMHRVKFKDGDTHGYCLNQEAMVWLDIPELSTDSAIRKCACEEGGPIPVTVIGVNDENKPPAKLEEELKAVGVASDRNKPRREKKEPAAARKITRRQQEKAQEPAKPGKQAAASSLSKSKTASSLRKSSQKQQAKVQRTGASLEVQAAKANGIHDAVKMTNSNDGGQQSQLEEKRIPLRPVPQGSPTPLPPQSASKPSQKSSASAAVEKAAQSPALQNMSKERGVDVKVVCSSSNVCVPGSTSLMRSSSIPGKRSRTALTGKICTPEDESAVKQRALSKLSRGPTKEGQKTKPAQRSRQGSRLCKNSADLQFVEHCEVIKGCRIGVWWPKDKCHYKGRVKGYDGCHRTLTVEYDDGITEKTPRLDDCEFQWLLPRGRSAGATDRIHSAFQSLGATNATDPVHPPDTRQSVAVEIPVKMEVQAPETGLHPSRPSPVQDLQSPHPPASHPSQPTVMTLPSLSAANHLLPAGSARKESSPTQLASSTAPGNATSMPMLVYQQPLLSQQTGAVTSAMNPLPHGMPSPVQAHAFWMLQNPNLVAYQPPVPPAAPLTSQGTSVPALSVPSVSPSPSPAVQSPVEEAASQKPLQDSHHPPGVKPPHGAAAEGWKVSLKFRGNGQVFEGRILAYKPKTKKHHVLWDDGEDEWIDADQEDLTWVADCKKTPGYAAGALPGTSAPTGQDLVGWKVALYWKLEGEFYQGIVESCDEAINQHRIVYADGEVRYETMSELPFKLVLPPNVKMRQGLLQTQDSDAVKRGLLCRRSRKKQRAHDTDDSDEELSTIAPIVERRSLSLKTIPTLERFNSHQSIKRLPSGRGSLLMFGDQVPMSPVCSPLSPQNSTGLGSMRMDSRCAPACVKSVRGLRDAAGFRVGVKRVRVFLNDPSLLTSNSAKSPTGSKETLQFADSKPEQATNPDATAADRNETAKEGDKKDTALSAASMKTILERVEQAKENIRNGMPLEALDSGRLGSVPSLPSLISSRSSKPFDRLVSQLSHDREDSPGLPKSALGSCNKSKLNANPLDVDVPRVANAQASVANAQASVEIKAEPDNTQTRSILSVTATPCPSTTEATPPPSPFSGVRRASLDPSRSPNGVANLMLSCSPEKHLSMSLPHTPLQQAPSRGTPIGQESTHEVIEPEMQNTVSC